MEREYEYFTHKNGVTILEDDCIFWFDSIETFLDEELNQTSGSSCKYETEEEAKKDYLKEKQESVKKQYTMKDLREYLNSLEDWIWEAGCTTENEKEICVDISNETVTINKLDNSVTSTLGHYNNIHNVVEDLLNM